MAVGYNVAVSNLNLSVGWTFQCRYKAKRGVRKPEEGWIWAIGWWSGRREEAEEAMLRLRSSYHHHQQRHHTRDLIHPLVTKPNYNTPHYYMDGCEARMHQSPHSL
jgi:hypothetical protein